MALAVRRIGNGNSSERTVLPGLAIMACAVLIGLLFLALSSDLVLAFPYLHLLPWVLGLSVVLIVPSIILYYQRKLAFYDPIVFATFVYFVPSFVVGGLMLAGGWSQPTFLAYIQDPEYNLPYTVLLIGLGFAGMAAGYFLPLGRIAGAAAARYLPTKDFDTTALLGPGLALLVLGTINTAAALFLGIVGYQKVEAIDSYSGILFLSTLFWMQGSFILWYIIFKRGEFDSRSAMLVGLLLAVTIGKALFSGNRAALLQVFIIVVLAFLLAGGKFNLRRATVAGGLLAACVIAGMIYGSTFRDVKGSESRVTVDQYTESIFETFDHVARFDFSSTVGLALSGLAERLDTLSSVAVVVSNYEQLEPYEESYGLDNNIWKDTSTFFIPRILWSEKPIASEPRKYSDLYFDYGENSFAITPMGDLVRNFGPFGVPIGMLLFGIILRFLYRALIENQPRTIWRSVFYFMILMNISYEGFYGLLIPNIVRASFTATVGLLIVGLIARSMGYRRVEVPA